MAESQTPPVDPGPEPTGYAAATEELEAILAEIEGDAVDVDVLTARVARAALLIRWCRSRIDGARVDVERIVAELEQPDAAADGTATDDDGDGGGGQAGAGGPSTASSP